MILIKKILKDKDKETVYFVDENNLKQGKEVITYKNEDKIVESEYLDDNIHGYCFVKKNSGEIIREQVYWHGYHCDKEVFKKLLANYRLELSEKKYEF